MIAVKKLIYFVIYYNFQHTFLPDLNLTTSFAPVLRVLRTAFGFYFSKFFKSPPAQSRRQQNWARHTKNYGCNGNYYSVTTVLWKETAFPLCRANYWFS